MSGNGNEYEYENNNYELPQNNSPIVNAPRVRPLISGNNAMVLEATLNLPSIPGSPRTKVPIFKPGTEANMIPVLARSRQNSGAAALQDVKAQLASMGDEAAQLLLYRVALDDILNHMRSVDYDEEVIAILMSLTSELESLEASGGFLTPDLADQVKEMIAEYYTNIPGVVYPAAREFYLETAYNRLRKNKAATRIASGFRGFQGRKTAKGMRQIRNLLAAMKAANAAAAAAAAKAATNKKAEMNAARKAAFEKRYGPGSKRKTRRGGRRAKRN
jgi:hypothetical protein